MIVNSSDFSVQVVLGAAVTTNQLEVSSSYRDVSESAYAPGAGRLLTNDTTAVDAVPSCGATLKRVTDYIGVHNADTALADVEIKFSDGVTLWQGRLLPGETVVYAEGAGWRVIKANSSFGNQSGGGNSTIKTGAGVLKRVIIGVATLTGSITIYDNTTNSGTIIALLKAGANGGVLEFDCEFGTGLHVDVANAADDITCIYE